MKTINQVYESRSINRDELFSLTGVTIDSKSIALSVENPQEAIILAMIAMFRNRIDEKIKASKTKGIIRSDWNEPDTIVHAVFLAFEVVKQNINAATWIYSKAKELTEALDVEYPANSLSVHASFRMFFNDSEYYIYCNIFPVNEEIDRMLSALKKDFIFLNLIENSLPSSFSIN